MLRTALAASVATGTPFEITDVRARRSRPGLLHQHLAAVRLAAAIGDADVRGAELGSDRLRFAPRTVVAGDHSADVGTAGSACLVAQTGLLALLHADEPASVTVSGGTHNRHAPPFEFLDRAFLPAVSATGPSLSATLHRHGFEPEGGGRVTLTVTPGAARALDLTDPGAIVGRHAEALLAGLPDHIGERELDTVRGRLGWPRGTCALLRVDAAGQGNVLLLSVEREHVTEVVVGFGRLGVPAEQVAEEAVREVRDLLDTDVAVGPHLADQLLLPLALGAGGTFTTPRPTTHFETCAALVRRFLGVAIEVEETGPRAVVVRVG